MVDTRDIRIAHITLTISLLKQKRQPSLYYVALILSIVVDTRISHITLAVSLLRTCTSSSGLLALLRNRQKVIALSTPLLRFDHRKEQRDAFHPEVQRWEEESGTQRRA